MGGGGELESLWLLFGIRLRCAHVELRPAREHDLAQLAAIFPDDAEHDPNVPMLDGLSLPNNRKRLVLQGYWGALGSWSVDSWCLNFVVSVDGRTVGVQSLEADHFPELRVVDSGSWLAADSRRQGVGRAMRAAVLALAFDHLGAAAAVSSAREDNLASLGVSRSLGYRDNGVSASRAPTGPCTLRHMRLRREDWQASGRGATVEVHGVSRCGPWFGVEMPLTGDTPA